MSYNNDNNNNTTDFIKLRTYWGITDYKEDHLDVLINRENNNRLLFKFQSPQIEHRKTLVAHMKEIAATKLLDNASLHLAIYLLDVFMDNYIIAENRLHLCALVCLLLASKFEERDGNILKISELNDFINNQYALSDYSHLEILILKHLKWNLLIPTSVHFVNVYIEYLFTKDDPIDPSDSKELWFEAKRIIQILMDYVMEDVKLMQTKPSMIAAAIIAATRNALDLENIWPPHLEEITRYNYLNIQHLYTLFKNVQYNLHN